MQRVGPDPLGCMQRVGPDPSVAWQKSSGTGSCGQIGSAQSSRHAPRRPPRLRPLPGARPVRPRGGLLAGDALRRRRLHDRGRRPHDRPDPHVQRRGDHPRLHAQLLPRPDRHADRRRRRGRRARAMPIRRSSRWIAPRGERARGASPRCAPARSCSPRPACSTAAARPPTGRAATQLARALSRRSTVERDPIFVRDGDVSTSAGVTAGMDLALALVEDDLGREVALTVARWLVLFVRRPGGQSQFSAQLAAQSRRARAAARAADLDRRPPRRRPLGRRRWPTRAHMSARNFARAFRAEIGHDARAPTSSACASSARAALLERPRVPVERGRRGAAASAPLETHAPRLRAAALGVSPARVPQPLPPASTAA